MFDGFSIFTGFLNREFISKWLLRNIPRSFAPPRIYSPSRIYLTWSEETLVRDWSGAARAGARSRLTGRLGCQLLGVGGFQHLQKSSACDARFCTLFVSTRNFFVLLQQVTTNVVYWGFLFHRKMVVLFFHIVLITCYISLFLCYMARRLQPLVQS